MWKRIGLPVLLAGMIGITGCGSLTMKEEKRELELSAKSVDALAIDTASGDITIRGDDDAKDIRAVATIRKSAGVEDDTIVFTLERDGDTARLVSELKPVIGLRNRTMHIEVTVPAGLKIELDDGSGQIDIAHLKGGLRIHDGSGDMKIKGVQGETVIEDGSGEIELADVADLKTIRDDSGEIELDGSGGDLTIHDQSGKISINRHAGNVDIDDDSGNVTIEDLRGSVTIRDGSGNIDVRGVDGDVTIPEPGSGNVRVKDVKGKYAKT